MWLSNLAGRIGRGRPWTPTHANDDAVSNPAMVRKQIGGLGAILLESLWSNCSL